MSAAVYEVCLDTDRDSTFDNAIDNVSTWVIGMSWNNGMSGSFDEFAPPSQCQVTLDNTTGIFTPELTTSSYYTKLRKGVLIRIRATFQAVTYTLGTWRISDVQPSPGYINRPVLNILAQDAMLDLLDAEYFPILQTSVTTDQVLSQVFDSAVIAYPYPKAYWILEIAGASELDNTTYLYGHSLTDFDTGKTTLAYAGDNSDPENKGVAAQGVLRDAVTAECGGKFFYDARTSKFVFHNRHNELNTTTITASLTNDDYESASYKFGDDVISEVTINYQPRKVGSVGTVLWTDTSVPYQIRRGETRSISVHYTDATVQNARVGATAIVPLQATVDYIANSASNGTGTSLNQFVQASADLNAQGGTIKISNQIGSWRGIWSQDLYITTLQVRGTPLYAYQQATVKASSGDTLYTYGHYPKPPLNIAMLDDQTRAQEYADYLINTYNAPNGRLENIQFNANKTDTRMSRMLNAAIGNRYSIADSALNHSREYILVGEQHIVTPGGENTHEVTWVLKTAKRIQGWLLETVGRSELDSSTYVVF